MTHTKEELKLALTNCASGRTTCKDCGYDSQSDNCFRELSRDALEYIMELENPDYLLTVREDPENENRLIGTWRKPIVEGEKLAIAEHILHKTLNDCQALVGPRGRKSLARLVIRTIKKTEGVWFWC